MPDYYNGAGETSWQSVMMSNFSQLSDRRTDWRIFSDVWLYTSHMYNINLFIGWFHKQQDLNDQ